ncbi:MAG: hypothetical protein FJX74_14395 [Armatimonadetes bacterium]|nr:hypothetical protein [Armatimonadota bacterium]
MTLAAAFVMLALPTCGRAQDLPQTVLFADDFPAPHLDPAKWVHTSLNDFQTEVADVVDGRLRMGAATIGTDDRTVKFHGVRTAEPVVDLSQPCEVCVDADWNDQANGCYMTVAVYLCPTVAENPRDEPDWLALQYIGVPPGRNARCWVSVRTAGHEEALLTENWPEERTGRSIGRQKLHITLDRETLAIAENGASLLEVAEGLGLSFDRAYLYLQHTSHSNYRMREVFFDNVLVGR